MTAELPIVTDPAPPKSIAGITLLPLHEKYTREGICKFRESGIPISSEWAFRKEWGANKREWMERGFGLRNHNGKWYLQQWLRVMPDGQLALTPIGASRLAELIKPAQSTLELPKPEAINLELPELPPEIAAKLFDYQVEPARQLLRALTKGAEEWGFPGAWDCSEMGVGKTYQALAAAIATGLEVGVVCPLAVIPAWSRAFQHFGQCPRFIRNYESLRTGRRDYVSLEEYTNENGKKAKRYRWNLEPKDTILIFDEAHLSRTIGSLNQGLLMAAARQRFPLICASGTLATDPTHMRATGRVVGLHQGGKDFQRFLLDHNCEGKDYTWKFKGGRHGRAALASIHRRVFPARGARVRIEDLGDRFPETQIMCETFDTGETQAIAKAFKEAEQILERMAAQGAPEWEIKMRRSSAYMEAWHNSERCKVPAIADMAEKEIEEGRSVAVFVNFTDVRESLMHRLKTRCAIYGGQAAFAREACIADFQADRARAIIANIDAGGVGVSLHDINGTHPRTAIILPTNKVVSLTQALGRVHRAGGKSRSRQIVFYAAGTVEEQICDVIRKRMAQISTLNDGELYPSDRF